MYSCGWCKAYGSTERAKVQRLICMRSKAHTGANAPALAANGAAALGMDGYFNIRLRRPALAQPAGAPAHSFIRFRCVNVKRTLIYDLRTHGPGEVERTRLRRRAAMSRGRGRGMANRLPRRGDITMTWSARNTASRCCASPSRCRAGAATVDARHLRIHALAREGAERTERLVQQQHARPVHQRAPARQAAASHPKAGFRIGIGEPRGSPG